jgi:hypothetical protein
MSKILLCEVNGKQGFKKGENGYCYTHNDNLKSKKRAYYLAVNSEPKQRLISDAKTREHNTP